MKKLTITLLILLGFVFAPNLYAQGTDLFSFMEEHLSPSEQDQLKRAKDNIAKGDKLESQIKEEDKKVQKYFSKKKKKGEKKSVAVKELRIRQALYYEKAYALIYNVYSSKINGSSFIYEEDEAKANDMMDEALTDNAGAKRKMKAYKSVTPKDLKKDIEYSKLKSDLQGAMSLYISSINSLIEAYSVFLDQETKKQLEEEENRVWQNAESENTIYGYQTYLSDFPNGKYASQARSRISDLEEEEKRKKDEASRNLKGNLEFQVQIAASKKPLPKWKIAKFYKRTNEVTTKNYDGWHKYAVGSFKKYEDAKNFVKAVKVKGAFVVAYLNGEKLDIKEAIKIQ
jgi:hypothetical protein